MELMKGLLTSLLSVGTLFLIAKVMGHKEMSQLDFFDYICGITIGSIAAELSTELEEPLQPQIATVVYGAVAVLLSKITSLFPKPRKYINGTPTIVMNDGKIFRENLRDENLKRRGLDDKWLQKQLTEKGYGKADEVFLALCDEKNYLTVFPME